MSQRIWYRIVRRTSPPARHVSGENIAKFTYGNYRLATISLRKYFKSTSLFLEVRTSSHFKVTSKSLQQHTLLLPSTSNLTTLTPPYHHGCRARCRARCRTTASNKNKNNNTTPVPCPHSSACLALVVVGLVQVVSQHPPPPPPHGGGDGD